VAHNMSFLSSVSDDVVVMAEGKVLTRGRLAEVQEHKDVIAAYLGTPASAASAASEAREVRSG
jgi:ABC-type branched-subunit amino acid transport system ATPase component